MHKLGMDMPNAFSNALRQDDDMDDGRYHDNTFVQLMASHHVP